jgi:hypothetical protein
MAVLAVGRAIVHGSGGYIVDEFKRNTFELKFVHFYDDVKVLVIFSKKYKIYRFLCLKAMVRLAGWPGSG